MKKLLYTLAGLSALALFASCNKEAERTASSEGEVVTATFTVAAPEGVATKAISDGSTATNLIVAVYDETDKYLEELSTHATISGGTPTWNVSMKVIKDLTYRFVFIAKSASDNGFSTFTPSTGKLAIDYSKLSANDDNADFFFVQDQFKVENSFSKTEEMHRPLAQVNFGASDLLEAGYSINTETMLTGVKLTGIYSEMNVLNEEVTGTAGEVTFTQSARVPAESPKFVDGYDRIAMVYALVAKENQSNVTATLNVKAKSANAANTQEYPITREVANVPLKRNYRTNILGNIFTSDFNFTVNTVPGFATPEINETLQTSIAKANDLFAAGQTSVTVDLAPDADGIITLPATTEDVRLNLNITTDKTITIQYASGAKPAHVEIYAKDVENIVAELTSSTVIITSGSHIHTGTFATAASTLIIEATAKVDNLVVNAGSTKIYGEVGTISGDAADKAAYYIATVDELKAFRDLVNGGKTYEKVKVVLENDLDLSSVTNWTPIGTPSAPFKGQFDGNGKTISHLTIVNTADNIPQALFGYLVGYGASFRAMVKNLTVDGADIKAKNDHGTAVVVGSAGGYTTVSEVTVKNATLLANRKVGGVANGYIQVLNCHAENVSVTAIPNEKDATYDNGDKVGAIVGYHGEGSIEVIGNTADNVTVRAYRDLGGIIGIAHTDNIIKNNTVTNSTIIRDASTNKYADESKNAGKVIGRYGTNVTDEGNVAGDDVKVIGLFADGIEEDEEGILHILSKTGLESFRDLVNAGNPFSGKTFILDTDIDLNNELWEPIGINADAAQTAFQGTFDGNGKTISNLNVDLTAEPAYRSAGLFGATRGAVVIKNFTVSGASIKHLSTGSATVNGIAVVVGSLSYYDGGTVQDVKVVNATLEGNRYIGGIAGYAKGTIKDCSIDGLTIVAKPDNLSGSYDNGDKVGGILGFDNQGSTITDNEVKNFSIKGYRDLGGIVGGAYLNSSIVSGNTVTDGTITVDQQTNNYGTKTANAAAIVGRLLNGTLDADANTSSNVLIKEDVAEGISYSPESKTYALAAGVNLSTVINNSKTKGLSEFTIDLSAGSYNMVSPTTGSAVTIKFQGKGESTEIKMENMEPNATFCTLEFNNLKLICDKKAEYKGIQHGTKEIYNNCYFTGVRHLYALTTEFNNCHFTQDYYQYCVFVYGTNNCTFNNCTFNTGGKTVKIYKESESVAKTVTFQGCTFTTSAEAAQAAMTAAGKSGDWKTAIEIDGKAIDWTININNCTETGHKQGEVVTSSTMYNVDSGSNNTKVYIDGVQQTKVW